MSALEIQKILQKDIDQDVFPTFCNFFNLQVLKNPKAIAVKYKGVTLTYKELAERAADLANHLKMNGLKAGDVVALGMYNCLDLIVGIVGIFMSGGVYLPIDPNYPFERIEEMVDDAKPSFFITEKLLEGKFSELHKKIFYIDNLPDVHEDIPLEMIRSDSLAYIVYTSGSTGKPKGIVVDHRALAHAALAYKELHPDKETALMIGSISFDPSLLIVSYILTTGGTVCLPQNKEGIDPKNPDQIIELIQKHSVSLILCTPSLYSMILNKSVDLSSLKCIDLCGENIPNNLPNTHQSVVPNAYLFNVYGPSEYAMGATAATIYDPATLKISEITVGKPFSKNRVFIFDENFNEVGIGEKGEICIGGPGLAQGYLHLKELTEERFVWTSLPNGKRIRLYRTGDMGVFLPNGNIKFLGRTDNQIKILGHRIELDEVERTLSKHPDVNEAAVIVRKDKNNQNELIAYFSTFGNERRIRKLKAFLKRKLPTFMIPSQLVQVTSWCYNQNGKIDRKSLAKQDCF